MICKCQNVYLVKYFKINKADVYKINKVSARTKITEVYGEDTSLTVSSNFHQKYFQACTQNVPQHSVNVVSSVIFFSVAI